MSPAHVLEPTYRRLKSGLMSCTWPGGTRLEAGKIADEFGVSMTPVRDSLNRLVGEELVAFVPGQGYRVPAISEKLVRDLLETHSVLVDAALARPWKRPNEQEAGRATGDYAERLARIFAALTKGSGNRVLASLVERVGTRLHPVRLQEHTAIPAAPKLLADLEDSLDLSNATKVSACRNYHKHICERVPELVEAMRP